MKDFFRNIKWFFKNLMTFKKVLWEYRPWDYEFQIKLFSFGLKQLSNDIDKDKLTNDILREKKVNAINELIYQLNRDIEDEHPIEKYDKNVQEYYKDIKRMNNERYDKIARILKGQDSSEFKIDEKNSLREFYEEWEKQFDGTGIEHLWT